MLKTRLATRRASAPGVMLASLLIVLGAGCQPTRARAPDDAIAAAAPSTEPQAPSPEEGAKVMAQQRAGAWLALVDRGAYAESWDAAAAVFKASTSRERWNDAVTSVREPLGMVSSRQLRAAEYKGSLPGAPEGKYVVVHYDSAFAKKPSAREVVTLRQAADASWNVAGYFVE